ncbi:hypothetical protein [Peribacillus frigoritolerans]|uniref:hypothetical protein n=1 Tax=Peribacillus frigoritolerans TaxID=450367 RepID=UPI0014055D1C|nr:hypothetical protein [Peribacillus frigoritolerans]
MNERQKQSKNKKCAKSPDFSKYFSILAGKRKIPLNNLTKVFHTGKGGEQNGSN